MVKLLSHKLAHKEKGMKSVKRFHSFSMYFIRIINGQRLGQNKLILCSRRSHRL